MNSETSGKLNDMQIMLTFKMALLGFSANEINVNKRTALVGFFQATNRLRKKVCCLFLIYMKRLMITSTF